MGAKKPSVGGFGGGAAKADAGKEAAMENIISPDNKRKKQEDWNYLKQTLRTNNMMNGGGDGA